MCPGSWGILPGILEGRHTFRLTRPAVNPIVIACGIGPAGVHPASHSSGLLAELDSFNGRGRGALCMFAAPRRSMGCVLRCPRDQGLPNGDLAVAKRVASIL
eukprot:5689449-Alexandrium_andersonii.AAC.1